MMGTPLVVENRDLNLLAEAFREVVAETTRREARRVASILFGAPS
jgi:hypothetical protein